MVSVVLLSIIVLVVITIPRQLAKIFTNDTKLLDLFERCRYEFAAALFMMNFAVVCERVPFGMGRAKAVLYAGAVGSWVGQVPAVILCVEFWRKDLQGASTRASLPDMPFSWWFYWGSSSPPTGGSRPPTRARGARSMRPPPRREAAPQAIVHLFFTAPYRCAAAARRREGSGS